MGNIYLSGQYLQANQTWHSEDSPWKAEQIDRLIQGKGLRPKTIAEIGCGAGVILNELSKRPDWQQVDFKGYDISPQAIDLARRINSDKVSFVCEDLLSGTNQEHFDLLLIIDVFEHVPDYLGFVQRCKEKAEYKIFHIPLDVHVSSVVRNAFIKGRYTLGHLHYFTADSALATLKDTGYEIHEFVYTNSAAGLFSQHPTLKRAVANIPRWLLSKFNLPITARLLGGYSLLVLTK